ncbi:helix-turn-helix domain-containing protein [Microvirga yunnanensis]|uniref:helix-turn-helix domain-containing protein n=1 Tax=Microvirga yunnanensis TaxID=2953740 RepID=UPI0021C741B0|nr:MULTISPECIES: helix-turn-helix domain-containing protein [unclassified Microvirga]
MYASHLVLSADRATLPPFDLPSEAMTLDCLFAHQPMDKLAVGEALFWEGDMVSNIFQMAEGCLRLYRILPDGRRAIMGFVFAGELLGLSCQGTYRYTAEAITPVRLRRLSRARLNAMGEGAEQLRALLMTRIFEEMSAAQQHIVVLGQLGAEERVAHFLVSATCRTGANLKRPVVVELPMTRQDIADYLGLTVETVCRVLSKFKRDGLIAPEGRHMLVLRRMSSLQDLAGEVDDRALSERPTAVQRPAVWPN